MRSKKKEMNDGLVGLNSWVHGVAKGRENKTGGEAELVNRYVVEGNIKRPGFDMLNLRCLYYM